MSIHVNRACAINKEKYIYIYIIFRDYEKTHLVYTS